MNAQALLELRERARDLAGKGFDFKSYHDAALES